MAKKPEAVEPVVEVTETEPVETEIVAAGETQETLSIDQIIDMLSNFNTTQLNYLTVAIHAKLYPQSVNKVENEKYRLQNEIDKLIKDKKQSEEVEDFKTYFETNKKIEQLKLELAKLNAKEKYKDCYQFQDSEEIFSLQRGKLSQKFINKMKEFANVTDEDLKDRNKLREKIKEFKFDVDKNELPIEDLPF